MRWILIGLFCFGLPACKTMELTSRWTETPITIDGNDAEWESSHLAVDGVGLVGVRHDANYVYLCLVPVDRQLGRQIIMSGLNIWFDTTASQKRLSGLRYPAGIQPDMMRPFGEPDTAVMNKVIVGSLNEVDLLGADDLTSRRFQLVELKGISARTSIVNEKLICELRIPRHANDYLTLGHSNTLDLLIETPEFKRPEGGPSFGGRGGMRPGGMGDGGRPGGIRRMEMLERKEIKIWLRVYLASSNS